MFGATAGIVASAELVSAILACLAVQRLATAVVRANHRTWTGGFHRHIASGAKMVIAKLARIKVIEADIVLAVMRAFGHRNPRILEAFAEQVEDVLEK